MIFSPDGHTRPFDRGGDGTVFGSGAGLVLLKRLEDAVAEGDRIRAVIKGSAVNNDGAAKVGYTAPSIAGQEAVIREVFEETGVHVTDPVYKGSQPWPFPSSLMLGFVAESDGGEIELRSSLSASKTRKMSTPTSAAWWQNAFTTSSA